MFANQPASPIHQMPMQRMFSSPSQLMNQPVFDQPAWGMGMMSEALSSPTSLSYVQQPMVQQVEMLQQVELVPMPVQQIEWVQLVPPAPPAPDLKGRKAPPPQAPPPPPPPERERATRERAQNDEPEMTVRIIEVRGTVDHKAPCFPSPTIACACALPSLAPSEQ